MHDLRCKTTYVASYRTEGCAVQILLAYLLGGPHGIQTKITLVSLLIACTNFNEFSDDCIIAKNSTHNSVF